MTDADLIADRRRLRRRLTVWRALAFLGVIVGLVAIGVTAGGKAMLPGQAQIARVDISGFISGDKKTLDLIKKVSEAREVSGVIVKIDSPGGTTSGAEALYDALRVLAAKKPTVTFVDSLCASGGYIAALATDHIVARQTSLVGSIGVLFQYPNFSELLGKVGVAVESVKSSPLKASPDGLTPTSPEARAALASLVGDTYAWFKNLVRDRRHMNDAELTVVSDGRVFTGHQSKGLKLIDEIGTEKTAQAWLEREKGVAKDLPVKEWKPQSSSRFGVLSLAATGAAVLGFGDAATALQRLALQTEAPRLDGLLAVWQPAFEK
jgi:protease-4